MTHWFRVSIEAMSFCDLTRTDLGNKGQAVLKVIEIPALWEGTDKSLCLVRALSVYLKQKADGTFARGYREAVHLHEEGSYMGDVKKSTISFWVRNTILSAYQFALKVIRTPHRVRANNVQSMATSWAFMHNVALEDVMDVRT